VPIFAASTSVIGDRQNFTCFFGNFTASETGGKIIEKSIFYYLISNMFDVKRFTGFSSAILLASFLTPSSIKAETAPQQAIPKQVESVQLKTRLDGILEELRSLNLGLQAGMTYADYATRVTRLNQAYFEIKGEQEFRDLSGGFWLASAINSHMSALRVWQGLFTETEQKIYQMEVDNRQRNWESADETTDTFIFLRGLFPKSRINSMNSHCHEHPDSTLCN
jgi:hypothetical protein